MLDLIGTGLQVLGQVSAGKAARRAGESQQAAAEYSAEQLDINAEQAIAVSHRAAAEQLRKSMLVQSRALAIAAASGAGALDPTVMALIGGYSKEGELASETVLYGGEERARAMREQAKASRYEGALRAEAGRTAEKSAYMKAAGSILSGATKEWGDSPFGFTSDKKAPISESDTHWVGR